MFEIRARKRFRLSWWTSCCAASEGHLECLTYAHENGCPWHERTCSYAAEFGHLECLKYAHENGCPWNEETCFMLPKMVTLSV